MLRAGGRHVRGRSTPGAAPRPRPAETGLRWPRLSRAIISLGWEIGRSNKASEVGSASPSDPPPYTGARVLPRGPFCCRPHPAPYPYPVTLFPAAEQNAALVRPESPTGRRPPGVGKPTSCVLPTSKMTFAEFQGTGFGCLAKAPTGRRRSNCW